MNLFDTDSDNLVNILHGVFHSNGIHWKKCICMSLATISLNRICGIYLQNNVNLSIIMKQVEFIRSGIYSQNFEYCRSAKYQIRNT